MEGEGTGSVLCLGGAGRICGEAVRDLVAFSTAERITIADPNVSAAQALATGLGDPRVDCVPVDVTDHDATVALMRNHDIVMDGTAIRLNEASTACIAAAGCHGVNLNGFGAEYPFDDAFRRNGRIHVPGFGMTPGVTDMMVRAAADPMESVDTVRVSHGAFRPIAFSPSIMETTAYEYDPNLEGRVVYEDGAFKQVPPFARERLVELPPPYGTHPQWIIPHAETRTAAEYLREKGVRLVETRGTWPPENMTLIRALYDWGFFRNDRVRLGGAEFGIMEAIGAYLHRSSEGTTTRLYGYALHVEVEGVRDGAPTRVTMTHTHPPSDGTVAEWSGLRAYTRCVGIPLAIATQLILGGKHGGEGVVIPERAFDPYDVFAALEKRGIRIHTHEEDL